MLLNAPEFAFQLFAFLVNLFENIISWEAWDTQERLQLDKPLVFPFFLRWAYWLSRLSCRKLLLIIYASQSFFQLFYIVEASFEILLHLLIVCVHLTNPISLLQLVQIILHPVILLLFCYHVEDIMLLEFDQTIASWVNVILQLCQLCFLSHLLLASLVSIMLSTLWVFPGAHSILLLPLYSSQPIISDVFWLYLSLPYLLRQLLQMTLLLLYLFGQSVFT